MRKRCGVELIAKMERRSANIMKLATGREEDRRKVLFGVCEL
jgi:hypothetical protein